DNLYYTSELQVMLERAYSDLRDIDGAVKSFVISRDSSHYYKFLRRSGDASAAISNLKTMVTRHDLRAQMEKLDSLVRQREAIMLDFISSDRRPREFLDRLRSTNDVIDDLIHSISAAVELQEGDQVTRKHDVARITPYVLLSIQILIVIVLFLAYRFIARELRNRQLILGELRATNEELRRSFLEM